ncbi:MAG: zf-HC2 domain-containing protein [Chloroflexi bacterium]|nr:MAG: zf-HC2 domain-containing protein [Chloroflexota bacterium]
MKCEELVEYVSDYIDNNLSEELSEAAREHLATCENCRIVLNSTQQMILLYREHGKAQRIPKQRQQALYDELSAAFAKRNLNQDK